jgi:hypothetical protein
MAVVDPAPSHVSRFLPNSRIDCARS